MDVKTLLIGSARVNQMKRDIHTVIKMVFGFLTNVAGVDTLSTSVLYQSEFSKLVLSFNGLREPRVQLYRIVKKVEIIVCTLPGNDIPLEDVQIMYGHLDDFVKGVERLIPSLQNKWEHLARAAILGLNLYYEIQFHDESVRYRKKCSLPFPLPLTTEVFISLEGEPTMYKMFGGERIGTDGDDGNFFEVTGYKHEVTDFYGEVREKDFVMILEASPKGQPDEKFRRLLGSNGWADQG